MEGDLLIAPVTFPLTLALAGETRLTIKSQTVAGAGTGAAVDLAADSQYRLWTIATND